MIKGKSVVFLCLCFGDQNYNTKLLGTTIRAMTAEGAPTGEICAAFKPAWHEYRVGLYQKSLRQISEKRLRNAMELCLEADRALKLSPQGYTALEQLICKF